MDTLDQLKKVSREITTLETRRSDKMIERDRLLIQAREEKLTWAAIQDATGLSPRGLQLALQRAAKGHGEAKPEG